MGIQIFNLFNITGEPRKIRQFCGKFSRFAMEAPTHQPENENAPMVTVDIFGHCFNRLPLLTINWASSFIAKLCMRVNGVHCVRRSCGAALFTPYLYHGFPLAPHRGTNDLLRRNVRAHHRSGISPGTHFTLFEFGRHRFYRPVPASSPSFRLVESSGALLAAMVAGIEGMLFCRLIQRTAVRASAP